MNDIRRTASESSRWKMGHDWVNKYLRVSFPSSIHPFFLTIPRMRRANSSHPRADIGLRVGVRLNLACNTTTSL